MTNVIILSVKEVECIMWCIGYIGDIPNRPSNGPDDPLTLLQQTYSTRDIVKACRQIESRFGCWVYTLPTGLQKIEQDILRLCVENTRWIEVYKDALPHRPDMKKEAHDTLLSLARKFDEIGIEVNYMPPA